MFELRVIGLCTLIDNLKASVKHKLVAQYNINLAGYQLGRSNRTTTTRERNQFSYFGFKDQHFVCCSLSQHVSQKAKKKDLRAKI